MESKNVKFDRSVGDKALFTRLRKKFGTEKAVTQPSLVTEPTIKTKENENTQNIEPSVEIGAF